MLNSNASVLPTLVGSLLASPGLILNVAALHRERAVNNASAVMTAAEEDASRAQCNDSRLWAAHSQNALWMWSRLEPSRQVKLPPRGQAFGHTVTAKLKCIKDVFAGH